MINLHPATRLVSCCDLFRSHEDKARWHVCARERMVKGGVTEIVAITLINRQQIGPDDFKEREGGAVEFTDAGRKRVIKAYQERKQDTQTHALLDQNLRIGQMPFIQARVLARCLRGDLADYVPLIPK